MILSKNFRIWLSAISLDILLESYIDQCWVIFPCNERVANCTVIIYVYIDIFIIIHLANLSSIFCIFITMYKKTCNYDAFFHLVFDAYFDLFFLLCYCFPPYCWLLSSVNAAYPFHLFHVNLITVSAELHTESFFSLQGSWEWN